MTTLFYRLLIILIAGVLLLCLRCKSSDKHDTLFRLISPSQSGIHFTNQITFTEEYNPYIFKNFLNGGGVAAGDINNDGLCDLYFAGNMVSNRLYLNKGKLHFEDITKSSGTESNGVWSTGVSMADINGDGWLDIYVCKSGRPDVSKRHNELFLNNKDLTFTEVSHQAGLADLGLSTHAVFFDYDKDGDLDCYLLNNSIRSVGSYDLIEDSRLVRDTLGGNKLYENNLIRNENGRIVSDSFPTFTDVSERAGIYGSAIGFGLGVSVADLNGDSWPDLYVSNDFFERDYLYLNQQDGTFKEALTTVTQEISMGSMGADIADLDNDGWPEIFVTEMLPDDPVRYKTKAIFDNWPKYKNSVSKGYHRQFGRNVLQHHRGLGPDSLPYFSETGRYSGVHATDWSWGALIADFDNNSMKDIFVANGIYKDLIDLDYVNFYFNPEAVRTLIRSKKEVITTMFDAAESKPLPNQLFLQDTGFLFTESSSKSGMSEPTFSNGSVYADLDNDGDLEIIINNVNMPAMIYKNHATEMGNHYIKINLKHDGRNSHGVGSKVIVYACNKKHYYEVNPMRGFQSSVEPSLTIGLGNCAKIDSVVVLWPYDTKVVQYDVASNATLFFHPYHSSPYANNILLPEALLQKNNTILGYRHIENQYSDFDRDRLTHYMVSNEGPGAAVGDLDGNGLDDIVIGGSRGYPKAIFYQERSGQFTQNQPDALMQDSLSEDLCVILQDVDCDGRKDIYMTSGSSELPASSSAMRDRLYINAGNRKFISSNEFYHAAFASHHAACIADFDKDQDPDLVAFSRLVPFSYGVPGQQKFYINDDCQSWTLTPDRKDLTPGMVTDALAADIDNDGDIDIIVAYEYGPVRIFLNDKNRFVDQTSAYGLDKITGLWKDISIADLDRDGDTDIIAGNHGLNSRLRADTISPLVLFVNDYDQNGQSEHILCRRTNGQDYPIALKDDLLRQLPYLNKKYTTYASYAGATMSDMFTPEQIDQSIKYEINELRSAVFYNEGNHFRFAALPAEAQLTTQYASWTGDINGDQLTDMILGGNQYSAKPEMGINAASYGTVLLQNDKGNFVPMKINESGFLEKGSIRQLLTIFIDAKPHLLVIKNDDYASLYSIGSSELQRKSDVQ